jgi:hypothetical protein
MGPVLGRHPPHALDQPLGHVHRPRPQAPAQGGLRVLQGARLDAQGEKGPLVDGVTQAAIGSPTTSASSSGGSGPLVRVRLLSDGTPASGNR